MADGGSDWKQPTSVLGAALLVALLAPFLSLTGTPAFWRGEFLDADCFLRLQRVLELFETGAWFDPMSERTDAPWGEELHWTRPFDVLIALGAWPLSWLLGLRPALEWWGAAISPLLLVPTLALLRWGMAPVLGPRAVWGAVPFFLVQPQLLWVYIVGRPDHHSLLALCAAAVFAVIWRAAAGAAAPRHAAWAGAAAGIGLWVGVEAMVTAALGAGMFGLAWLVMGGRDRIRLLAAYLVGMTGMVAVALAVEYPPEAWGEARYVKLSVVHLLLAAAAAATWTALARLAADAGRPARRLAWTALGAGLPVALLAAVYPDFFGGPLVLHPREAQLWSPTVGEMSMLLPVSRDMMVVMLGQLGLPLLAAGFLLAALFRRQGDRPLLLAALLPLLAFTAIGLMQSRWSSYAQLAAVFPLLLAGRALWAWPARLGTLPLRALALGGFYSAHLFVLIGLLLVIPAPPDKPKPASCRWPEAADAIRERHPPQPGADILFSHMFPAPELMWRSGYRVVAAPYISNTGIADSIRVFAAAADDDGDEAARQILHRRQVSLLLVCGHDGEAREYRGEKREYHQIVGLPPAPPDQSLHARLVRGEAPDWLEPLDLGIPEVRLYRVR